MTKHTNKKIWITRPTQDASYFLTSLSEKGYDTFVDPLLNITYNTVDLDIEGCQAVIFTSANGVRAYLHNGGKANLPVYAVGDATGMEAKNAGFENVYISQGDVMYLSETIKEHANPLNGALYHGAGSVVAKDLSALLNAHNYTVKRQALYEAVPSVRLSEKVQAYIEKSSISAIILMSPRTADIFLDTVRMHKLDRDIKNVIVFALSDAVAQKVSELGCKVIVADYPTQADVIEKIELYLPK